MQHWLSQAGTNVTHSLWWTHLMHRNMQTDIDFLRTLPLLIVLNNLFSFFGIPLLLLLLLHLNWTLKGSHTCLRSVSEVERESATDSTGHSAGILPLPGFKSPAQVYVLSGFRMRTLGRSRDIYRKYKCGNQIQQLKKKVHTFKVEGHL